MNAKRIYLSSPYMSTEGFELQYIHEAFEKNWIAPLGDNVDKFEQEFQSYLKRGRATALSSGTASIHLGLKALGVGKNDKPGMNNNSDEIVLCPSLTFSASANPIVYLGATPVFIDSEEKTWNMDPKALKIALEKYKGRVKAVIVVHLYGTMSSMDEILSICDSYNVPVIEDAAEALGSFYSAYYYRKTPSDSRKWHEKPINVFAGTAGDIGVFSFNGNKIITTSGGGMLVSNHPSKNEEIIEKVHFWSTQSREKTPWYQHEELGYNYRMSNILAGIGRGQLKVLERHIEKKELIFNFYRKHLEEKGLLKLMPIPEGQRPNLWLSCAILNNSTPSEVISYLDKHNVEARHIWKPMHMQPFFSKCDFISANKDIFCETVFQNGLCLPSDLNMNDEEKNYVVNLLTSFL